MQDPRGLLNQLQLTRFTLVATLSLLVYEYLITFKDEKRLVWPSKLSTIKIAYMLNRYLPFVATSGLTYGLVSANVEQSHSACKPGFLIFGSLVFLTYVIAEFILYIRAYAAWGGERSIGIVLLIVFLGVVAMGATFIARFFRSLQVVTTPFITNGCIYEFRNQVAWVSMVTLIVSETFALAVLLARAPRLGRSKMIRILIADGIFYYVFVLLSSLVNTIVLRLAPPTLCNFLLATQGVLHSIFCNRLLLNIRGAYVYDSTSNSGHKSQSVLCTTDMGMDTGTKEGLGDTDMDMDLDLDLDMDMDLEGTQVLDTTVSVSAFQAISNLTMQSRGREGTESRSC